MTDHLFRRILFPTDFSENSLRALEYALLMTEKNEAELMILYTYRLINNEYNLDTKNRVALKKELEAQAGLVFDRLDRELLSLSGITYTLLSEIGFVADRILANVDNYNIDLIILCDNMQKRLQEKPEKSHEGLIHKISCPIMLVPTKMISGI